MHLRLHDIGIGCFKDVLVLHSTLATGGNDIRYLPNLDYDMMQGQGIGNIEPLLLRGYSAEFPRLIRRASSYTQEAIDQSDPTV